MRRHLLFCGGILIATLFIGAYLAHSQTSSNPASNESVDNTVISDNPGVTAYNVQRVFNGDDNPTYIGYALSRNEKTEWSIGNGGLTSIVDAANTATVTVVGNHGLTSLQRVFVDGATDTDLNSTDTKISAGVPQGGYVITVTGASTFTFTSASVTDATYNARPLLIWTYAPRTNRPIWKIYQHVYTTTNPTQKLWAEGIASHSLIWDSRTTYAYH